MNVVSEIEAEAAVAGDELWYKDAIIYQLHVKAFADSNNDGIGDFAGLTEQARLSAGPRRHRALAAAVLSVARPRRRLRHRRLSPDQSRLRHDAGLPPLHAGSQAAEPARHHRAGDQSHLRPASLVSARARAASPDRMRETGTSGATATSAIPARASSSPIPRNRTGPGTRQPQAYYWHRFFSHQPDLNFDNPRVLARDRAGDAALARYRRRRLPPRCHPVSVRAGRHQQREPARNARRHPQDPRRARRLRAGQGAARRGQPVAGGRQRLFRRRRRMPHGLSLPADAAHLHGDRAGRPLSDHRYPAADAGYSRRTASGRCSCATTTS